MGRVRVSARTRARAGVFSGGALVTAGVWVGVDLAAALMVAGVLLVAYCLLVMDVDGGSR
ncbi:hypothetical protein EDD93_3678 [Streptomyces sp. 840.1]|nr:hypothetical protein EDD93_3678 [Streptomyces sp. 840.1]